MNTSIPIDLIVENAKYQQFGDDFGDLKKDFADTKIVLYPDKDLGVNNTHAKTFVGDTRRVIQTANLTHTSLTENREHFFFGTDKVIRENLLDLFDLDEKTIQTKKKNTSSYQALTATFSPNLLVCPLDCRQKLESLIKNAKTSIWISAQYITDEHIMELLRTQGKLDIRVLTNDMASNKELVRYFGKKVVRFEKKIYNHDKMMIIDNKIMVVGSMNFSQNALDNNREIGIILTDKKFIQQ
jgi:phosphatidylserine/phosphatidylglycerophosphate/cardiolipin synthase-like enzyme